MPSKESQKLRECPFCGGKAEVSAMGWKCKDGKDRYFIECCKCGTRCGFKALPINQAIEKWNRRYTPSEIDFDYEAED